MRRETQNILLVLLGGALLKLALTGTYLRYVKESLQPWLVVTGGVMVVLALVSIARDIRDATARDRPHFSFEFFEWMTRKIQPERVALAFQPHTSTPIWQHL